MRRASIYFCYMRKTKTLISCSIASTDQSFVFHCQESKIHFVLIQIFKTLACLCSCADWLVSYLVEKGTPKTGFLTARLKTRRRHRNVLPNGCFMFSHFTAKTILYPLFLKESKQIRHLSCLISGKISIESY